MMNKNNDIFKDLENITEFNNLENIDDIFKDLDNINEFNTFFKNLDRISNIKDNIEDIYYKICKKNNCKEIVLKNNLCAKHIKIAKCNILECHNLKRLGGLCYKHGGKKKCKFPECKNDARKLKLCRSHLYKIDKIL